MNNTDCFFVVTNLGSNKVGHLLSELGSDLKTSDTLLITLLSKIGQCKFDTTIPTVDDQPL